MKSINALEKIKLGNIDQWIAIRTQNDTNPILLFLHGGPGTAQIAYTRKIQYSLEKDFIVVNWDQRGAGKSYNKNLCNEDLSPEHYLSDTEELIEYLLNRFHHKKLFLAGHSWGSYLGIKTAAKRPELLYAYIGIGQIIDMKQGDKIAYQFAITKAELHHNKKAIQELKAIGKPPYTNTKDSLIQRKWVAKLHGTTVKGTPDQCLMKNISLKDITPIYLWKFIKGSNFTIKNLAKELTTLSIVSEIKELKTKVYFIEGRHDFNVPSVLVEKYIKNLIAPKKELIWFENSAHFPNFEEPELFTKVCSNIRKDR